MKIVNIKILFTGKLMLEAKLTEFDNINIEITNIVDIKFFHENFEFEVIQIEYNKEYETIVKLEERNDKMYKTLKLEKIRHLMDKII